jgi:hypothetical protein
MARYRTIKPEFWEDEKLGQLSVLARLTFAGLFSQADDEGRGRGSTAALHRVLHGFARDVTREQMQAALGEIEAGGFAQFYDLGGQRYYFVPNFLKHQVINKPLPSKLPAPPPLPEDSHTATVGLREDSRGNGERERSGSGVNERSKEGAAGPPSATAPGDRPEEGLLAPLKFPADLYSPEELEERGISVNQKREREREADS